MIKERDEILKSFSKPQLEALKSLFDEEIIALNNVETITSFEEMVGRRIAIQTLKEIMRKMRLLKEKVEKSKKNEYL